MKKKAFSLFNLPLGGRKKAPDEASQDEPIEDLGSVQTSAVSSPAKTPGLLTRLNARAEATKTRQTPDLQETPEFDAASVFSDEDVDLTNSSSFDALYVTHTGGPLIADHIKVDVNEAIYAETEDSMVGASEKARAPKKAEAFKGFLDPLILLLSFAFLAVIALMIWQANRMQASLIESTALQEASSLRNTIVTVRSTYSSDVVARVKAAGGIVSHDFKNIDGAIPIPATLTILLGEKISEDSSGGSFRLFSEYPFPWRTNGGPRDSFETEALVALKQNPSEPFYRIETLNGQSVLRYAHADIMEASCVECHNTRADSPKTDWKVGDVRGVMEVNLPLSSVSAQANASLRTIILLIIAVAVLAVLTLFFFLRKTRQTNAALQAKREQEIETERLLQEEKLSVQEQSIAQARELQTNINSFMLVLTEIAQGDFSQRGQVSNDVLGDMASAINLMVEDLSHLIRQVQTSASSVNGNAEVMSQTTQSIVLSAQKQLQVAKTARQEILEVHKTIQDMAVKANASAKAAHLTLSASEKGTLAVSETLSGMQGIRSNVQSVAQHMSLLSKRSEEISSVVESVTHISSQINLLALSAALEAAGAGEAGARFAAVADEVKRLAEESADFAGRITDLISYVRKDIKEVVYKVESSSEKVEAGYTVASEAGQRLKEISAISKRSAQLAQLISQTTQSQVQGIATVHKAVGSMSQLTQSSQPYVLQARDATEKLRKLAEELNQSLARFRLG